MSQTKPEAKKQKLVIELSVDQMHPGQVRLIRSINTVLGHLATTCEEADFFEQSAELMRLCASLIQQTNFTMGEQKKKSPIAYGDQALEYSIDTLQEQIHMAKVVTYDN